MASENGLNNMSLFLELAKQFVAAPQTQWMAGQIERVRDIQAFERRITVLTSQLDQQAGDMKERETKQASAEEESRRLRREIEEANKKLTEKDQQVKDHVKKIGDMKTASDQREKELTKRAQIIKDQGAQHGTDVANIERLNRELANVKITLEKKSSSLQELESLFHKLPSAGRESITSDLDRILKGARKVAATFFHEDTPSEVFSDRFVCTNIQKRYKRIPLYADNTLLAKKARVAICLSALGARLESRIFLPYYFERDEDEELLSEDIVSALSTIAREDPLREQHVRGVLLAIRPEEQRRIACQRGSEVADEVIADLGPLLDGAQRARFEAAVRQFCTGAIEVWMRLRSLKQRVKTYNQADHTNEYWTPADLDALETQTNGVTKEGDKRNGLATKLSLQSLKENAPKMLDVVWPGFSIDGKPARQGWVVLETQVKAANDQPHRGNRVIQRQDTQRKRQA